MNKKTLATIAYVLAGLFVVLAVVYFSTPADHLPGFLPGHSSSMTTPHIKHGIACIVLALGCATFGWFQGGPKQSVQKD
jgi:uncharacterized membrane protein